jgi:hypothetical protein
VWNKRPTLFSTRPGERISAPSSLTASSSLRGSPGLGFDRGVFGPVSPGPLFVFLSSSAAPTLSNPTSPRKSRPGFANWRLVCQKRPKKSIALQRPLRVFIDHHVRPTGLFRGLDADTYYAVRDLGSFGGLFLRQRPWIRLRPHALSPLIPSFSSLLIYSGTLPRSHSCGSGETPAWKICMARLDGKNAC